MIYIHKWIYIYIYIALKPIFDLDGHCVYTAGILFDASNNYYLKGTSFIYIYIYISYIYHIFLIYIFLFYVDPAIKYMQIANKLIEIIPDTVPFYSST